MVRSLGLIGVFSAVALCNKVHAQCFEDKLFDPAASNGGLYGKSIDVDEDVMAVSAVDAVTIYRHDGADWRLEQQLETDGIDFGAAISVSGNWLLVGAPLAIKDGMYATGGAVLFEFDGQQWIRHQTLFPTDNATQNFGTAVAIDGSLAVIGAPGDTPLLGGSVAIYRDRGASWHIEQVIRGFEDGFGSDVAARSNLVLVGSRAFGRARLYRHDSFQWIFKREYLTGNRVALGAFSNGTPMIALSKQNGYVEIHDEDSIVQTITRPGTTSLFGHSIEADRGMLVVTDQTVQAWPRQVGTAYVYDCAIDGCDLTKTLYGIAPDPASGFSSIAVFRNTVALGHAQDGTKDTDAGAAYVYGDNGGFRILGPLQGKAGKINDFAATCAVFDVEFFYGTAAGSSSISGCPPSASVDIDNAQSAGSFSTDGNGNVIANVFIPNAARGQTYLIQAVTSPLCKSSNLIEVTFD